MRIINWSIKWQNPTNVITFLSNLQKSLKEKGVVEELKQLSQLKHESTPAEDVVEDIKPWDRDYLLGQLQKHRQAASSSTGNINEYFSIGTVIAGLDKLFNALYDISLVPVAALKGKHGIRTKFVKSRLLII